MTRTPIYVHVKRGRAVVATVILDPAEPADLVPVVGDGMFIEDGEWVVRRRLLMYSRDGRGNRLREVVLYVDRMDWT